MSLRILPVYVSSTWRDLEPERKAVEQAVNRLRETKFVGMEYFGGRDETTRRASLDEVDRAAESGTRGAYVGIFAARYGSGITEDEYRRARELGLPCFIYFKDDSVIPADRRETDPAQTAKLEALKRELRANHLIGPAFKNPDDLAALVTADLHRWLFDEYLTPKLRAALDGEVPRAEAQALLDAVRAFGELSRELRVQLQGKGFNVSVEGDFVAGDKIVYNAPAVPTLTLHQLRAPVGDFVGREKEIAELLSTLRGGGSAAITGISGMGGIGKTELSFYVATELRDVYPDAQLVVDMRGTDDPPRDPSDALATCIRAFLGPEQRLPDDLQELTKIYRSVLEGKRALILLDNARDSAQVRPFQPPVGSALLITSRNVVTLPRMTRVTLEQLEPVEARELLTGIAPRVPEDTADRICFLCGYLPLAIRAAGSLLDVTADLKPSVYAEQLQDERRRLELIGAEGVDLGVEASFGLSYARLAPDAARVFRRLAVFPATFDARAEETVCEDPGHKHLTDLLRRNLVRYNGETQRYSLHDLARLFADSRMSDDERHATRLRHAEHYLSVLNECDELYLKGGEVFKSGLVLFDLERLNVELGQKWAYEYSSGDETSTRLCSKYPHLGVYVLQLRQHPRERIIWLNAALAATRQLKDYSTEAKHLSNLGNAYVMLGEPRRGIEYYEQSLGVLRKLGDRRNEGIALANLGIAYNELGEHRRAIGLYEQCLPIAREVGDRRDEAHVLSNLGVAYAKLQETRQAVEFYEQSLIIAREVGDLVSEGVTLGNLGAAYKDLGETSRAVEFYEQSLIITREVGDRYYEGVAHTNASIALDILGDRAQAIRHAEAALEIFEQIEHSWAEGVRAKLAEWRGEA